MSSDFSWKNLEDVTAEIIDRRGITPRKLGGDFSSTGHRVISAKLVKAGQLWLDIDEPRFIDSSIYKKWMKTCLQAGDVLMTSEAPLGEVAYLAEDYDWALGQRLFAIRPLPEVLNGRFLYYALQTSQVRADILGRASGTTVQGIRQAELRLVKIPIPSLPLQTKIAQILGALDDRITLLRETNKTLEAIAQAIYKSWFVDFDPVHAKAEGRAPEGMDEETAALFPDEFEKSELGLVPKGWKISSLSELCNITSGKRPPNRSNIATDEHAIPLYGGAGIMGFTSNPLYEEASIVTGRVGTLGKVYIALPPFWASDNALVIMPKPTSGFYYIYYWVSEIDVQSLNRGSTQPLLTQKDLRQQKGIVPFTPVLNKYEEITKLLFSYVQSNDKLSQTLASLRDTLLPRLISGKLRLPEAEAMVEEVI